MSIRLRLLCLSALTIAAAVLAVGMTRSPASPSGPDPAGLARAALADLGTGYAVPVAATRPRQRPAIDVAGGSYELVALCSGTGTIRLAWTTAGSGGLIAVGCAPAGTLAHAPIALRAGSVRVAVEADPPSVGRAGLAYAIVPAFRDAAQLEAERAGVAVDAHHAVTAPVGESVGAEVSGVLTRTSRNPVPAGTIRVDVECTGGGAATFRYYGGARPTVAAVTCGPTILTSIGLPGPAPPAATFTLTGDHGALGQSAFAAVFISDSRSAADPDQPRREVR